MKKRKKFRLNGFGGFLLLYASLLILLITFGLYYVWNILIDYEAGMPDVNMEKFLAEFEADNIKNLLLQYPVSVSEYDKAEDVEEAYVSMVTDREISYAKLTGKYTNAAPVYEIYAGDDIVAAAKLLEVGKNKHGFSVWDMTEVIFDGYGPEKYNVSIKVPESANVLVNGTLIDEAYRTGTESVELTANISEYVEQVPEIKIYELNNLIRMPDIEVAGDNIAETGDENYTVSYTFGTDKELEEQLSGRIMAMAHEYGAYIINKGSLSTLKSYMVGKAREYVSNIPAVWAYLWNEEYTYNFTNEEISNFVRYSEDCFSCDISYTLNVFYRTSRSISYDTYIKCMYVKQDGAWYLADFMLLGEE